MSGARAGLAALLGLEADVAIVGAGAAGCLLAAKLARAGRRVVVLEAGPAWQLSDLTSNLIWSRRLKWGGAPVLPAGDHPFSFNYNAGWGFGGAALHHFGAWPRLHEEDFKVRSLHGRGFDWPMDYGDLQPWYDRVQEEVGLSGDAEAEVWRPAGAAYPMPPLRVLAQGEAVARGFTALGMRTAPTPAAINSTPYKGRPACIYDGWCEAGCPIHALANPLVTYKPEALAHGAEFRADCEVVRVLSGAGARVQGVEFLDAAGELRQLRARAVVLAASVVQNPRILFNSASERAPNGLGNRSGLLGKFFMTHALINVFGLFQQETHPHEGVSSSQLICHDRYGKNSTPGAFGSRQWLIAPAIKPNDLLGIATNRADLIGRDLARFMEQAVRQLGNMTGFAEELPMEQNRIELSAEKDARGVPLARLHHTFSENTLRLWRGMAQEGRRIFEAGGAREVWTTPIVNAHMMGGTLMGDDPAASVTDSYGRCHDLANLFIAGGGLFPTAGAANPTFTLHALALRTAEHMIENWPTISG